MTWDFERPDLPELPGPPRSLPGQAFAWRFFLLAGLIALVLGVALLIQVSTSHGQERIESFHIDAAGQAVLIYDPLENGIDLARDTHTVIFVDRAPHLCGDPDGTGRFVWLFDAAYVIEARPRRPPGRPAVKKLGAEGDDAIDP